jgi:hypothetical protein
VAKKPNVAPKKEPAATPAQQTEPIVAYNGEIDEKIWADVLDTIRQTHNTIYSVLRMAEPDYTDVKNHQLVLKFGFPFHQKRMNESKNKQVLIGTLAGLGITGYEITCEALPRPPKQETTEVTLEPFAFNTSEQVGADLVVDQIRSVFGGAEVLE